MRACWPSPSGRLLRSFGSDGGQLERTLWREGADLKVAPGVLRPRDGRGRRRGAHHHPPQ